MKLAMSGINIQKLQHRGKYFTCLDRTCHCWKASVYLVYSRNVNPLLSLSCWHVCLLGRECCSPCRWICGIVEAATEKILKDLIIDYMLIVDNINWFIWSSLGSADDSFMTALYFYDRLYHSFAACQKTTRPPFKV